MLHPRCNLCIFFIMSRPFDPFGLHVDLSFFFFLFLFELVALCINVSVCFVSLWKCSLVLKTWAMSEQKFQTVLKFKEFFQ